MIPAALQLQALFESPHNLAQNLRILVDNDPSMKNLTFINSCLLDQIHTEAIPSHIFRTWLFLASRHSYHLIPAALQDPSRGVRWAGIRVARDRLFCGPHWKVHGWDLLGGAEGIKDILDGLPSAEVKHLVNAICYHCGSCDRQMVMGCIDELLTLVENTNAWTERSLSYHASLLYAYCPAQKVTDYLRSQTSIPLTTFKHLSRFHITLLRNIAVGATEMASDVRKSVIRLCRNPLLHSQEEYIPNRFNEIHTGTPPGLIFGMDLLLAVGKEPGLQSDYELHDWIQSILRLAIRKSQPFQSILFVLNSSLELCQSRGTSRWLSQYLSKNIIQLWSIAKFGGVGSHANTSRELWHSRFRTANKSSLEQCLIQQVLKVEDDNLIIHPRGAQFTKTVAKLLSLVHMKGRLELLQLLCQHSPTLKLDLTAWPPSEKERQFIPVWDYEILRILPLDSSKLLFKRSLHIYRCEEFLPSSDFNPQSSWALSWEEQSLLWVRWECSAIKKNGGFPVTLKVIDKMKQKATRAREATGRLYWANKVIKVALETQSLDIFNDVVKWCKRFLRDPLVFPDLIDRILSNGSHILSCQADLQSITKASNPHLLRLVQIANGILMDILEISLLLLREPWARILVRRLTQRIPGLLSTIIRDRIDIVKYSRHLDSITEPEIIEIFLDPLIPILIHYEREVNAEGQKEICWSGPSRLTVLLSCSSLPSPGELSFMDRLAKSRDEFWEQHRTRVNPEVLDLGAGWPRGLPIQHLVDDKLLLFYAMERPSEAPYLSSRVNEVLFTSLDTIMTTIPENTGPIDCFVDSLWFAISALVVKGEPAEKVHHILRIWEYYSSKLQPHSLYLKLFQDWLFKKVQAGEMKGAAHLIRPPSSVEPTFRRIPKGPEVIEWDPQAGDDKTVQVASGNANEKPIEVPYTILNCRMEGEIPANTRSITIHPQPILEPPSLWSFANSRGASTDLTDSIVLSALLFLDTFTKGARILRTKFPDVEHPRYTPIYLADEFITRETNANSGGTLSKPLTALRKCVNRVPSQILRDLIWSFLDTLKEEPDSPMYSRLLFCTSDLIQILLSTEKPQLAVDVVLRIWKEFAGESSWHRKISLVKIGRVLSPKQAGELITRFSEHVCEGLKAQQQQGGDKVFIKVTTAKMLAQVLAQADFLPQSTRMDLLQNMLDVSQHIDIRREIAASILALVSISDSDEPYKAFASIALSAAGPNERSKTTEEDWNAVESNGGPLPFVAPGSEHPILDVVVSTAATQIPQKLRSHYVRKVLLPLLEESTRQHTRWMAAIVSRIGLSISDLGITELEIGPFSLCLIDTILWQWTEYLPNTYLKHHHRGWALSYLHGASFSRINEKLISTPDTTLQDINIQEHWNMFLKSQRSRPVLYPLHRLLVPTLSRSLNDFNAEMVIEDFIFRTQAIARNPVQYVDSLDKYKVHPGYTLELLWDLRKSRMVGSLEGPVLRAKNYDKTTEVMRRIIAFSKKVRQEGWSTELAVGYPVTLPTTFEHEILMMPSPLYNATASEFNTAVEIFILLIIELIRKYATDSVLLLRFDALQLIMKEVTIQNMAACALRLGCIKDEPRNDVEIFVRIKLARDLLRSLRENNKVLDKNILDMIEEWKRSDIELVRQIGWECE
ncbi:hypothetical protein BGW36DRAFT_388391 [Talaromyces proteolyticus]|uniref:Uncharacterized protein n=1 Tax=Talaromyces proteolyticus TaxID=1131652 RepID=A0AAD4PTW5_9EURO|nr:uncharacterized protein BGW36DRAFT_388391 [Talaromyces proteolyticus]KAH8691475.1 hypothetical protein BGW36DRAFT_388391 [Talaromyces proteolyticus]